MTKTLKIDSENFEEEVLKSKLPILVDFWAPWCRPCLMMSPILDELSEEQEGKLKIGKVNVDEPSNQILAIRYQIQGIPNLKLFENGKIVKEFVGLRSKEMLKEELKKEIDLE
ncbi:thioredoxin [Patescibacteria group bacterium]|nr:thioredoxin [Patescibacteria group bacterium]